MIRRSRCGYRLARPLRRVVHGGVVVVALTAILSPSAVLAQDGLASRLRDGERVWVTMTDGHEVAGRVRSVTASVVEVSGSGGNVSIPLPDVRTIEVPDGVKNGVRNGAGRAAGRSPGPGTTGRLLGGHAAGGVAARSDGRPP